MKTNLKINEEKPGDFQSTIDINPEKKEQINKKTEKIYLFFIFLHSYHDYINVIIFYSINKIL